MNLILIIGLVILIFLIGILIAIIAFPYLIDYALVRSKNKGFFIGPWKTHLGVGRSQIKKIERAAIARVGLGANSSEETIYWNAFVDSDGQSLNSKYNYQIIITEEIDIDYENKGFWSITVYGQDQFLVENPKKKYTIRSAQKMNSDELPFIIYLGNNAGPTSVQIPLPTKEEHFSIALRCYRPFDVMKKEESCKQIILPEIKRL